MTVCKVRSLSGVWPQEFECCEAGEEVELVDIHPKPAKLQDRRKDQDEELIEFIVTEEGRDSPIFISPSLFVDLKQTLLDLLRKLKDVSA